MISNIDEMPERVDVIVLAEKTHLANPRCTPDISSPNRHGSQKGKPAPVSCAAHLLDSLEDAQDSTAMLPDIYLRAQLHAEGIAMG